MGNDFLDGLTPPVRAQYEALKKSYVEGLAHRLSEMEQAMVRSDWIALRACAHRLRGSGVSYGFEALGALAQQLEEKCDARAIGEIPQSLDAVNQEIARILSVRSAGPRSD